MQKLVDHENLFIVQPYLFSMTQLGNEKTVILLRCCISNKLTTGRICQNYKVLNETTIIILPHTK